MPWLFRRQSQQDQASRTGRHLFCSNGPWLKSRWHGDLDAGSGISSHRVYDSPYFSYLGRRKATELGMLFHGRLVFREIDAEALVIDDVGVLPLSLASKFGQGSVGGCGNVPELSAIHSTHAGQIAFDDI